MGTRCLTILKSEKQEIAVLYRQSDGYIDGHGRALAEYLSNFTVVNGIGFDIPKKAANGANCLSALIVMHFKSEIGQFYLYPAGKRDIGEDFIYEVTMEVGKEPHIKASSFNGDVIFSGYASEFLKAIDDGNLNEVDD